jgi:hypothetical protein
LVWTGSECICGRLVVGSGWRVHLWPCSTCHRLRAVRIRIQRRASGAHRRIVALLRGDSSGILRLRGASRIHSLWRRIWSSIWPNLLWEILRLRLRGNLARKRLPRSLVVAILHAAILRITRVLWRRRGLPAAMHHGRLRSHRLCAVLHHRRIRSRRGHGLGSTGRRGAKDVGESGISLIIRLGRKAFGTGSIRSAWLIVCHSACQL